VVAAEQAHKAMVINTQTYNWSQPGSRYPTSAELRNMLYGQVMAGAKGIVSFEYSPEFFARKELWNEAVAFKDEILGTLQEPILSGTLTRKSTADAELNYSYWEYKDACYVAILNTSYTVSKQATLTLPPQYTGAVTPLFARLPGTVQRTGTNVGGLIAPLAVQVYKVGKL
jgi:hypothetical protein